MSPNREPLPEPPYYAVIFTAQRRPAEADAEGTLDAAEDAAEVTAEYERTAAHMVALAQEQPGYLGMESTRDGTGLGITVSYWRDEAAILAWKQHVEHARAREQGRRSFYAHYTLRVAKVERAYAWSRPQ